MEGIVSGILPAILKKKKKTTTHTPKCILRFVLVRQRKSKAGKLQADQDITGEQILSFQSRFLAKRKHGVASPMHVYPFCFSLPAGSSFSF